MLAPAVYPELTDAQLPAVVVAAGGGAEVNEPYRTVYYAISCWGVSVRVTSNEQLNPPAIEVMAANAGSILFLGKADDAHTSRAAAFCERNFAEVVICFGQWGDELPGRARDWEGDYIVSYLSRWIVPGALLGKARRAAINFHPAPPEYPGIGCQNFALYEGAESFGVTCHHMAPRVDTGALIAVRRFPVLPDDDVAALLARSHDHLLTLFYDIASQMAAGAALPQSDEQWTREPFTRRDLAELMRISPAMSEDEIARRVRATSFGPWQPAIELGGFRFELKPK